MELETEDRERLRFAEYERLNGGRDLLRLPGLQKVERVLTGSAPGSGGKGTRFLSAKLRLLADVCETFRRMV